MNNFKNSLYNEISDTAKTAFKPMYKCALCDAVYESIEDRVKCEMACLEKKKKEEAKAAEEKKKAERAARKAEVDAAIEKAEELLNKYVADYGSYNVGNRLLDFEDALDMLFRRLP